MNKSDKQKHTNLNIQAAFLIRSGGHVCCFRPYFHKGFCNLLKSMFETMPDASLGE